MNCCDDFGKCTQGKNCPVRTTKHCCDGDCRQGRDCPCETDLRLTDLILAIIVVMVVVAAVSLIS